MNPTKEEILAAQELHNEIKFNKEHYPCQNCSCMVGFFYRNRSAYRTLLHFENPESRHRKTCSAHKCGLPEVAQ